MKACIAPFGVCESCLHRTRHMAEPSQERSGSRGCRGCLAAVVKVDGKSCAYALGFPSPVSPARVMRMDA